MKMKIRLALREEGNSWNAYMALADTMDGAKPIGSIAIGAIRKDPEIKNDFMELMKRVLALAIKETTGEAPDTWYTNLAPESERGGNA